MPIYQKNTWWDKQKAKERKEVQRRIKEGKHHIKKLEKQLGIEKDIEKGKKCQK
jgi:ferritin-like metal-binding protein YciE